MTRNHPRPARRAATLVETAVVLPLVFFFTLGLAFSFLKS